MKTIYKYPLPIEQEFKLQLPKRAEFLYGGLDPAGDLCMWYEVDADTETEEHVFGVFGAGHTVPEDVRDENGDYTLAVWHLFSVVQGSFVWHIYETVED